MSQKSYNIHLRGVDEKLQKKLKQESAKYDLSMNSTILELLHKGLGLRKDNKNLIYHDLDELAGTWNKQKGEKFLKGISDLEEIDEDLWK